ncbi:hypothetical protein FTV88_2703 [Heliorestis convoluta]|uniref:Uncharacterized protein n=1 Tax=Heliorestis convoluta TaxID=356322 RepID=A0A5Q2N614_9FIRM|nr:hypothetical protein FTV88_2703 [Heliorestis convoluta]
MHSRLLLQAILPIEQGKKRLYNIMALFSKGSLFLMSGNLPVA